MGRFKYIILIKWNSEIQSARCHEKNTLDRILRGWGFAFSLVLHEAVLARRARVVAPRAERVVVLGAAHGEAQVARDPPREEVVAGVRDVGLRAGHGHELLGQLRDLLAGSAALAHHLAGRLRLQQPEEGGRVLLTEILLPPSARQGTVCLIV